MNIGEFKTLAFIHPACGKSLYSSSASSLTQTLGARSNSPSGWFGLKSLDVDRPCDIVCVDDTGSERKVPGNFNQLPATH